MKHKRNLTFLYVHNPLHFSGTMDGLPTTLKKRRFYTMNSTKKKILGIAAIVVLIVALTAVFLVFREKPVEGSKSITITVIDSAKKSTVYEVKTDAQFLQQAMDEAEGLTYSGTTGEYGLMVETVNGESAIYAENGAYWSFYVNDEYCNYGIAEQPVEDGDNFKIVYTK